MSVVVTQGTKGELDWVYSQNLFGRGTGPFPFKKEVQDFFYYFDDTDIPEDAEAAWNYFANGGNNNVIGCCHALLIRPDIEKTIKAYVNRNGYIRSAEVRYVGKRVDPLALPMTRYEKGAARGINQNGYEYGSIYQPCVFIYKGGAPAFSDFNNMNEWLQSGSADYKSYGGIGAPDETPIDNPVSETINGELASFDGLTSATNLIDLATISNTNLGILAQLVGGGWLSGNIGEGIISLKLIASPIEFTSGSSGNFTVGPTTTLAKSGTFEVQGNKLNRQYNKIRIGSFTFENKFESYLDYAPYSTIRVYLPFCGMKDIDPEIVIGHTFFLDVSIDYVSGNIMYYGSIADDEGVDSTLYSWKGNCSTDIPITNEDFGYKVSQGLNIAGSIGGLIASKGASIVSTTETVARGVADAKYMESGSITSNDGFSGIMYPYVVLTYPITSVPNNYNHTIGRPSMKSATIGTQIGYTKVYSCHLENIPCTYEELSEIYQLLKDGVII